MDVGPCLFFGEKDVNALDPSRFDTALTGASEVTVTNLGTMAAEVRLYNDSEEILSDNPALVEPGHCRTFDVPQPDYYTIGLAPPGGHEVYEPAFWAGE